MSWLNKLGGSGFKTYSSTFFTEITVMVLSVLLYRVCLVNFGDEDFSLFSIYRRNFSFLQPLLMIGLGVGIPRYVSLHLKDNRHIAAFYSGATIIILLVCILSSVLLFVFSDAFSNMIYGSEKYSYLTLPMILMINGALIYVLSYSLYRGKLNMAMANFMQLLFIGIVPMLSLFICNSLYHALLCNGILWCVLALAGWFIGFIDTGGKFEWQPEKLKELLLYGIYRLPGDLALGFFFLLPVIVVIHYTGDTIVGGYMAFGITLINLVGSLFTPICVILLAQSGSLIAEKRYAELRMLAGKITVLVFALVIPGMVVFELATDFILQLYLSQINDELIYICRILFFASLGYALYIALRSIPDALFVRPINSFYILISLGVFGLFCIYYRMQWQDIRVILYGFVISVSLLGILTGVKTFNSIKKLIKNKDL